MTQWQPSLETEAPDWQIGYPCFQSLETFFEQHDDLCPLGDGAEPPLGYVFLDNYDLEEIANNDLCQDGFADLRGQQSWPEGWDEPFVTPEMIQDNMVKAHRIDVQLHHKMLSEHYEHAKLCLQTAGTIRAAKRACLNFISIVKKYPCRAAMSADFGALKIMFEAKVSHLQARDAENKRLRAIYSAKMETDAVVVAQKAKALTEKQQRMSKYAEKYHRRQVQMVHR